MPPKGSSQSAPEEDDPFTEVNGRRSSTIMSSTCKSGISEEDAIKFDALIRRLSLDGEEHGENSDSDTLPEPIFSPDLGDCIENIGDLTFLSSK